MCQNGNLIASLQVTASLRPIIRFSQQLADSAFHIVKAIWLEHQPARRANVSARGFDILDTRCEQDLDPWPVCPDPSQKLEAVESRHQDVGEDDMDGLGSLQDLDGFFAIVRHQDLQADIAQMIADRGGDDWLVVDHEDGCWVQSTCLGDRIFHAGSRLAMHERAHRFFVPKPFAARVCRYVSLVIVPLTAPSGRP
ncbi:MAG TPA: hypothetical protein VGF43_18090 [Dongiaceae bacterium]